MLTSPVTPWRALLERGLACGQAKQFEEAASHFFEVISQQPNEPDAHFNLGVAYRELRQTESAICAFEAALRIKPNWPEVLFNLGNSYRDVGRLDDAVRSFQKAVELRPSYLKALNNLANLLMDQGQPATAEKLLRKAISHKNDYAEGLFNLGRTLRRQRKNAEALEVTQKAANLRPNIPRYVQKTAELLKALGKPSTARKTLEAALAANPGNCELSVDLAGILRDAGKHEEALTVLEKITERDHIKVLILKSDIYRHLKRWDEALEAIERAVALGPKSAEAHNMNSIVRFAQGDSAAAICAGENAVAIQPDYAEAYNNLGAALQADRRFAEGRKAFEVAIRLKPSFPVARLNRSLCLMREGDYAEGWREFEWRFLAPDYKMPQVEARVWMGEELNGRTILLRCEQGLGDTLQFIRFAKLVKQRGGRVLVECQEPVLDLVSRCEGVDVAIKRGNPLPKIDLQIPMMSLPLCFDMTTESIPDRPYLTALPERVEKWRAKLASLGKRIVAVNWQGNPKFQADHLRSMKLENFRPLADIPDVALVSLQKNHGVEQLQEASFHVHHFTEELDHDGPFLDTAAILAVSDLVVTSDTSIAHLAGGMGRPVRTAIPYSPDWRWGTDGDRCGWYPTMRLYRQHILNNWQDVFEKIAADVRTEFAVST